MEYSLILAFKGKLGFLAQYIYRNGGMGVLIVNSMKYNAV